MAVSGTALATKLPRNVSHQADTLFTFAPMQLHERFEPGCEAAFMSFLESGCTDGTRFAQVAVSGEYIMRHQPGPAECGSAW